MTWIVVGAVVVALALAIVVARRRRAPDGVASFQRQIDALSPDARRSVVQRLEDVTKRGDADADDGPDEEDVDGA